MGKQIHVLYKTGGIFRYFLLQELHEPGENENERYDMLAPTYVKPHGTHTKDTSKVCELCVIIVRF